MRSSFLCNTICQTCHWGSVEMVATPKSIQWILSIVDIAQLGCILNTWGPDTSCKGLHEIESAYMYSDLFVSLFNFTLKCFGDEFWQGIVGFFASFFLPDTTNVVAGYILIWIRKLFKDDDRVEVTLKMLRMDPPNSWRRWFAGSMKHGSSLLSNLVVS